MYVETYETSSSIILFSNMRFFVMFVTAVVLFLIKLRWPKKNNLYEANNSLKLPFILNCVLKHANELKTISNWLVLLSTVAHEKKSFPNPLDTNLVPRFSHLTAPWSERGETVSSLAPGGGKMTDPGNEVGQTRNRDIAISKKVALVIHDSWCLWLPDN